VGASSLAPAAFFALETGLGGLIDSMSPLWSRRFSFLSALFERPCTPSPRLLVGMSSLSCVLFFALSPFPALSGLVPFFFFLAPGFERDSPLFLGLGAGFFSRSPHFVTPSGFGSGLGTFGELNGNLIVTSVFSPALTPSEIQMVFFLGSFLA